MTYCTHIRLHACIV